MPDVLTECLQLCHDAEASASEETRALLHDIEQRLDSLKAEVPTPPPIPLEARILAQLREPIIVMDTSGFITAWNAASSELFGYTADEAVGNHILFLYADDDEAGDTPQELFLEGGQAYFEVRRQKKSGEVFWAGLSLSIIRDDDGDALALVAHLTEITERRSAEAMQRLHATVLKNSTQGIIITDAEETIVFVNDAFTQITGYSADEAVGQSPDILRSGMHDADFRDQVRAAFTGRSPAWHGEIIGRRRNGELFPQSVSISTVRAEDGQVTHAFSIFSDITDLRTAERNLAQLANYDPLTGLPNRTLLVQLVTQALAAARRNQYHGALMVLDLHRFAAINDTFGRDAGNLLLREVAQRLRALLRNEDVVARIGGDEFAIALFSVTKREHGAIVAQKIQAALAEPFPIDGQHLRIGANIGISVYPEDGMDAAQLIQCAESAVKWSQRQGETGYLFYSSEIHARAKEHVRLEGELRLALQQGEFELHYQPKVSLRSGQIVGAEALIRWRHPEKGMVSPVRFIPVAEETGLILDIGAWVMDEACRQIRAWLDAGIEVPPIAINISARQFDTRLPERVAQCLAAHRVEPRRLRLEITESLLVRGIDDVLPIMNALVAQGLSLALDDFGTGYSSLAYLKKFPFSTLKIDRAFVVGIPGEENDCAIAKAIVTMGQQLRQEIVAEGVETVAQMNFLRELGCDQLQGYLFSPPAEAQGFAAMVRDNRRLDLP